jgi:hypothetical protein
MKEKIINFLNFPIATLNFLFVKYPHVLNFGRQWRMWNVLYMSALPWSSVAARGSGWGLDRLQKVALLCERPSRCPPMGTAAAAAKMALSTLMRWLLYEGNGYSALSLSVRLSTLPLSAAAVTMQALM